MHGKKLGKFRNTWTLFLNSMCCPLQFLMNSHDLKNECLGHELYMLFG